jgi:hypothetical protein
VKKFKDAFLTSQQQIYILENRLKEAYERELKFEQTNQDLRQREAQLRQENEVLPLNNQFIVIDICYVTKHDTTLFDTRTNKDSNKNIL